MACSCKQSAFLLNGIESNIFAPSTSHFSPDSSDDMEMIKVECECDSTENKSIPFDALPSFDDYPGLYGFNVQLSQSTQGKSSSFYSKILKQVFIDMNKIMLVHIEMVRDMAGLFVRALPVYAAPDYAAIPVNRCTVHSVESDPKGNAHAGGLCRCSQYDNVGHVIRSQSLDAQYCYNSASGRHSVIVPVKQLQPGSHSFAIAYYFSCKTSCPRGMQRRPINVVFTLETAFGEVLGRKVLGVRICTCPKRDKERLERDMNKTPRLPKFNTIRKRKFNSGSTVKKRGILFLDKVNEELAVLKKNLNGIGRNIADLVSFGDSL